MHAYMQVCKSACMYVEINGFKVNLTDKYSAMEFFNWHNRLTGSCEMGRKSFAKNNDIDLENDKFTVFEFIEKTKNDYGRDVIRQLAAKVGVKI
jgi:hypothetical protein